MVSDIINDEKCCGTNHRRVTGCRLGEREPVIYNGIFIVIVGDFPQ
jgi:hypothetical protein